MAIGSGAPSERLFMMSVAGDAGATPERASANERGRKSGVGTGLSHETRTDARQLPSEAKGRKLPIICWAMAAGGGVPMACCGDGTMAAYSTALSAPFRPFS